MNKGESKSVFSDTKAENQKESQLRSILNQLRDISAAGRDWNVQISQKLDEFRNDDLNESCSDQELSKRPSGIWYEFQDVLNELRVNNEITRANLNKVKDII